MSNANRDYAIVYDVKNGSLVLSRPLNFYITDKNTSNIFIKLVTRVIVGNGIDQYTDIENASNYVLTMRVIKPNNEVKSLEATQHEPENIFQFDLTEDFKDIPGKYICELTISTIVSSRQELTTSDPFNYEVKRSILSNVGEIIETEDTTVEKLLNNLDATKAELSSQIRQSINDIKTEIGTAGLTTTNKTIKGGINEVNSQINTLNTRVDNIANNSGGSSGGSIDTSSFATKTELNTNLSQKQDKLVSGTNIKTINGQSLLGNGNIAITSSGGSSGGSTPDYGIITDGVTDNSAIIRNALTQTKYLILPSGKIYLASAIELESGTTITSLGDTEIITNGNPAFTCNGTRNNSTNPPTVTFKENIKISNLKFTSTTNGIALNFKSVNKIRIHDCTTKNMGLLNLNSSFEPDARWDKENDPILACGIVNDDCLSNDIQIYNNVIYGNLEGDRPVAITLAYVKDVIIHGNIMRHVVDGVRIWGGDVGNSYNSDEMFRPCRYITVSNNLVEDVVGGIWAGRGEYITFTGNTVNRTTDVALDFEGCYSCTAVGNIVTDSRNGAMGVMFSAKKISFIGNTCTDTGAMDQGSFMFCHATDPNLKMDVYYANNTFISKIRMIGVEFLNSTTGSIILENNVFYNTTLKLGSTTYTKIKNNTFWVDPTLSQDYWQPAKAPLINITGMSDSINPPGLHRYNYEIVGNEFRNSTSTGLNDSTADANRPIRIAGSRWRLSMRVLIKDNKITGFNTSISYAPTADNASNEGMLFIELINNLISGEIVNEGVNNYARIYYENNKKINESENTYITSNSLSNYPNAIPTADDKYFWVKGTKIYFDEPDNDGYTGAICTEAGNPGTWRRFGKIS